MIWGELEAEPLLLLLLLLNLLLLLLCPIPLRRRAYFRGHVRDGDAAQSARYGTMRLNVRREHVFEDSFYQLRMRQPDEMRAKLAVAFAGEEGVDAGGVTREWYQVMSREMFNPQFSLFQPVPEGGSTFQPNPNSVIQNDEARGTFHLDFFKFVGRVVAKASTASTMRLSRLRPPSRPARPSRADRAALRGGHSVMYAILAQPRIHRLLGKRVPAPRLLCMDPDCLGPRPAPGLAPSSRRLCMTAS